MPEDNHFDYNQPQSPPEPKPEDTGPVWQAPQTANPAADLARQQLAQAYAQQSPQAAPTQHYNPYRPSGTETSYAVPPAPSHPPVAPAPSQAAHQQPTSGPPVVTSTARQHQMTTYSPTEPTAVHGSVEAPARSVAEIKQQLLGNVREGGGRRSTVSRFKPALTALLVGLAFLFVSYNEVAIAQIRQYISPGSSLSTPIIVDPSDEVNISQEPRIIIPKINVDVPVVYDEKSYDEKRIQAALDRGVVHYGQTALPGQIGNNVIVGHSSNNFFNSGQYKFAFVLLDRLEEGDTFILHYKGTRYIYKVFNKQIITPDDFSLIQPTDKPVTTLITCTPPGTAWRRLVVQAEQISPSIEDAKQADTELPTDFDTPVPGAAPSFWDRIFDIF